jgi:hypothetical protein
MMGLHLLSRKVNALKWLLMVTKGNQEVVHGSHVVTSYFICRDASKSSIR